VAVTGASGNIGVRLVERLLREDGITEVVGLSRRPPEHEARSRVRVPEAVVRALVEVTWRLRLQPTDRGWVELGLRSPLMDTSRARTELGWAPTHDAERTLLEALEGVAKGSGGGTPVLAGAARPLRHALHALRAYR